MMIIWKFNGKNEIIALQSLKSNRRRTESEYNIKYTGITFEPLTDVYECQISYWKKRAKIKENLKNDKQNEKTRKKTGIKGLFTAVSQGKAK